MTALPALDNVFAYVAGTVTSITVILILQTISSLIYRLPASLDFSDKNAVRRAMARMPRGAYAMLELSYAAGSMAGGDATARLAVSHGTFLALALGVLLTLCGVQNLRAIPHPRWVAVLTSVTYVPMSYVGARIWEAESARV